jgi:cell division FtsZ-interacting protein ZapD
MSGLKQDITLKFTPGAYRYMQEVFRQHNEFLHKLNPAVKESLIKDVNEIQSILKSAEKAGKKEVRHDQIASVIQQHADSNSGDSSSLLHAEAEDCKAI